MNNALNKASSTYILVLTILLITLWHGSIDIYVTAIPSMISSLSTDSAHLKLSIIFTILGFGFSQLIYGPLSDHYGRRHITLVGLLVFMIGSALCAGALTVEYLLVGRLIQGLGIGCAGAIATAVPRDIFSGKPLNQAFAYISTSIALTPAIAPLLGSYLQTWFSWREIFIFLLLYGLAITLLFYFSFPETNAYLKQHPLTVKNTLKNYMKVVSDRPYMGYLLCIIFLYTGELSYILQMPLILQHEFGLTPIENGWMVILTAVGMGIGAFSSARLVKYTAPNVLIVLGISIISVSALLMLLFPRLGIYTPYSFVGVMMVFMLGSGMTFNNCIAGCMERFPQKAGLAGALLSGLLMLGAGLSTLIVVKMPYTNPYVIPLFILACSVGLWSAFLGMALRATKKG